MIDPIEYTIRIPKGTWDNKKNLVGFLFSELNECFEIYKNYFDIYPNVIEFRGKRGKIMYDSLHKIFEGTYECKLNEYWNDSVVFKNKDIESVSSKEIDSKYDIPMDDHSDDIDCKVVSGIHPEYVTGTLMSKYSKMSSNFNIEKDIPTVMEFMIYDEESQDIDLSNLAPNNMINFF